MTTPVEFRAAFPRGVVTFAPSAVASLPIAVGDADWLVTVGLPRSAPPFLSFGSKNEINLPTVAELWGVKDGSRYRVIGSNGSGDPIAIDTATNGEVVYLNHDNAFQRVFVNSTVVRLVQALLAYRQLIAETQEANGPEAFLDGDVPPESLQRFVSRMTTVDPAALGTGMWADEIEELKGGSDAE